MFYSLKIILMPVLLGYSLGLNDLTVSSVELTVHVGDSALMGCVFRSTEEKRVTKVDWMFSSGKHIQDDYVLFHYANISVPVGRFQNRVHLVGDILHHDGSLLLQNVEEADQGNYTCEIRFQMESLVFKKAVVLHVLPEEPKELMVQVGDSIKMGCVFQSTEEKHVTRIEWMFSSGEHAQEEIVLSYDPKLNVPMGSPRNWDRFQNRVNLVGDISRNDGSIMLRRVKKSDGGSYTCSIHLGNLTFRKTIVLHVILKEPRTSVAPVNLGSEILGGNQLVIIVGIICATILLLPVLIMIVKRTHGNKRYRAAPISWAGRLEVPIAEVEESNGALGPKMPFSQRGFFLGLYLWRMEVTRQGVELELQLLACATDTATPDLSHVCGLYHISWQRRILNSLSEARD
uniref:Junctional adhesion molecule-like n=1 Tax=Sus scrofa TaxID=9823 RepID=A0A8D1NQB8_PIG